MNNSSNRYTLHVDLFSIQIQTTKLHHVSSKKSSSTLQLHADKYLINHDTATKIMFP